MWKYLFSSFDPRFGQQPDEGDMDAAEREDYCSMCDTIERNYAEQFAVDEAERANQETSSNYDSSFESNDSSYGN